VGRDLHGGDGVFQLLVTANVFPSSPITSTLIMEEISSFEKSDLTRASCRHIPEEGILNTWIIYMYSIQYHLWQKKKQLHGF
jgi:hypothetical protein